MTFSSRAPLHARLAPLAFVSVLGAMLTAGCENKHIGRPCDIGIQGDAGAPPVGGTIAAINPQALECPSRICILPGNETGLNTTSLCTADCSSDDDCSDGESGGETSNLCKHGFACIIPTIVGELCCRQFCVCKDFLLDADKSRLKPMVCLSGTGSTCKNVQ
jgi:hypothetical protein